MTISVKKIAMPMQQTVISDETSIMNNPLNVVGNIAIECHIRIGTLTLTIAELSQLKQGQVLSMDQKTHEPVDILVNNQIIARGELMCCDDHFAVRVTERAS